MISASAAVVASSVPLNFILKVKADRQRILSAILFTALIAYASHTYLESSGLLNYQLLTRICFVVSALGLVAAYSFYQIRSNHPVIAGAFGAAMVSSFAIWMVAELIEPATTSVIQAQTLEFAGSSAMAGLAVFVLARFFWLRSIAPIRTGQLRS
jgi:hypothetical protein